MGNGKAVEDSDRPVQATLTAGELLQDTALAISLTLIAGGGGLTRRINRTRIQKSGLALAGHYHGVVPNRIQILGETELSYLEGLAPEARKKAASGYFELGLSCVIITRGAPPPKEMVEAANQTQTPLFSAKERSSK